MKRHAIDLRYAREMEEFPTARQIARAWRLLAVVLLLVWWLSGCTSKTDFGECIGINGDKLPDLIYKVSVWNVVLAVVFAELIVPPVIVLVDETSCPTGRK